ncbi:MAG: putative ABC transport system permease protein, partial [bacterium F082]
VLGNDEFLGLTYWDKEELEMNIPEVEAATHVSLMETNIQLGDEIFHIDGMETDRDFFSVFPQYRFTLGSAQDFVGKRDILVSESFARRLSGEKSPLGRTVKLDGDEYTIKGVYADFDGTFFMPFDVISNIEDSWMASQPKAFNSIGGFLTWFRMRKDAELDAVNAKVKALLHKNYDPTWGAERVEKWRTYRIDESFFFNDGADGITRKGNLQMLRLLTLVVLLLLLSAIFNYVNLSLAQTGKRAKEMATRRLLGADKTGILWKYIGESVAFTAVCFVAALVLADLFAPMVNSLVSTADPGVAMLGLGDTSVRLSLMMTPGYIAAYILGILLLGAISGLLPALTASRYKPIDVIKGSLRRKSKMVLSKVFIVMQNVLAVFLIAVALVMEVQMRHMLTRPVYSTIDNRYYIEYSAPNYAAMKLFKDKVDQLPFVTASGIGRGVPGQINMQTSTKVDDEHKVDMGMILCDSTYFRLLGLEVQEDFGHPLVHSVWMSESAFHAAGATDTTTTFARKIRMNGVQPEFIGGVVHDFPTHPASEGEAGPSGVVAIAKAEELRYSNCLLISTTGEDPSYDKAIQEAYREFRLETSGVEEPAWSYGFLKDLNKKQL